ncbi:MAG: hypothetical protein K0R85_301 [Devosia sp.]|jgi:putative DNA primase/helicase|nr:hypothetical protein [Devosia sp.]
MEIASFPSFIADRLRSSTSISLGPLTSGLPVVGQRNDFLASIAGSLRRRGLEEDLLVEALLGINSSIAEPLDREEVIEVAKSISRYRITPDLTEQSMSEAFAKAASDCYRSTPYGWMFFNGKFWESFGAQLLAQEAMKSLVKGLAVALENADTSEAELKDLRKAAKAIQKRAFIFNSLSLATSDTSLLDLDDWGNDAGLLNFANGTYELATHNFRNHDREDRLTRALNYEFNPPATCPLFDKVLADALDRDTANFLMEVFGYALLGEGSLQQMIVLIGRGLNGKSTIMEAVSHAFGCYSRTADPNSLMKNKMSNGMNNDIHALKDARLVPTSELNTGQTLDAALVKRLTGGEEMSARAMYKDFETFQVKALVAMTTNMPPVFDGSDFGIGRRMVFVPFARTIAIEDVDPTLPRKLQSEAPGIMNRLIEGLRRYQEKGYVPSVAVRECTGAVLRDSNQIIGFLEECCDLSPQLKVGARLLYGGYETWCHMSGLRPMTEKSFQAALERTRGELYRKRSAAGISWYGVGLKAS